MAIKIPDALRLELAAMDLTIWIAHHPIRVTADSPRGRADKSVVLVQLAGPGLEERSLWGNGPTLRAAVDCAMRNNAIVLNRVKGLKGAIMRCEAAVDALAKDMGFKRVFSDGGLDDSVPF